MSEETQTPKPPAFNLDAQTGAGSDSAFAYDPVAEPWLFEGVRTRRIFGFLIDVVVLSILFTIAFFGVGLLGFLTFGLGWLLFPILSALVGLAYIGLTMGGPKSATPGMQAMGVEMRLWHGGPMYGLLAIVHALAFYFSLGTGILWAVLLGTSLFSDRKRCLHDIVLGTVVINSPRRVAQLRQ